MSKDYEELLFNNEYYIDRGPKRLSQHNEIFTPRSVSKLMLSINNISKEDFADISKTFLDPACGDGALLAEILLFKLQNSIEIGEALATLYGIDIMPDNIDVTRNRLLCGHEEYRPIVENNIVCRNTLDDPAMNILQTQYKTPLIIPYEDLFDQDRCSSETKIDGEQGQLF